MKFSLEKSIEVLEQTPIVLGAMIQHLSEDWTSANEGDETWTVYDVVGHLIHGEKTDWIPRMEIILSDTPEKRFVPFDRFAQSEESKGKSLTQLLDEFTALRKRNLEILLSKNLTEQQLEQTGVHPAFGEVTLAQLLSTWVVHDLDHISQISRVMAKQYAVEVGPWKEYLKILRQ
jgi:uncharacterized damage-inducible protein DinB